MAMFHFRLKSDKKPNGTKISAVKHVEYINREGSFSHEEHWKESNKFVGDYITTAQTPNALDGLEMLLYKTDDFGSIKNSERGIEVTENASSTTLSIALMLAAQTMNNQPLIIHGSPDFHKAVLQTALLANLPITFADRLLQNEFQRLKERKADDDKKFITNGGIILTQRPNPKPSIAPTLAKSIEDATKNGFRLPTLSQLPLVHSESKGTDMLLPDDESGELDAIAKEKEELETKDAVQISTTNAKNLTDLQEFISQKFLSEYQQELKAKMFTAVAEVNKWKRVIISYHDAQEQAKLEYMTKSERELWQRYFETLAQKKQLEEFLQTLKKPKETQKEALKAYKDLVAGVNSKIFSLLSAARLMRKSVAEIESRLESPECKKNILLVTHQILQVNLYAKKMLKRESDNLARAVDALQNEIFAQTIKDEQKNIYRTREVYDIIRRQYFGLKKEYEKTLDLKFEMQKRIITPQRAIAMAKNIFVSGDIKRLRATIRQYKKDEQRLAQNIIAVTQREKIFQSRDWSAASHSTFLQEKYLLTKQKTLIEVEKARLVSLKLSIEQKQTELESLYQKPDALKKIELIAAGILRKNYKFVRRLEEIETRVKNLAQRMNHTKEQLDALKIRLTLDKSNTFYKVNSDTLTNNQAASVIADAILFEPEAVQLVARSNGNNLEMEKDWELMSELDKDEFTKKKILREL